MDGEDAVDFQPDVGEVGEPSFEIEPPEAPPTEAAITWRWATAADLPALRVCHFQSEVEAGKELFLPERALPLQGLSPAGENGDGSQRTRAEYSLLRGEALRRSTRGSHSSIQANAAFGGLNYKMLGRNKTLQDVMRLSFMAPDFTEARARFAGQAAKPYGREQLTALVGGALAFYTLGRILNQAVDNDPHWDKPFSLVHSGKEYRLRTVQGDLWSAASEPGQYARNRLSPLASTAVRNQFGRKESLTDLGKDLVRSNVPIPLQSWTKNSDDPLAKKAFSSILKMIGVNESVSKTRAEKLAGDIAQSYMPDRTMTPAERARHELRKQIIDQGEKGNWQRLYDARARGLLDAEEARQLRHDVQLGPLAARVNHFEYADFMKVFSVATPEEQKQLDPIRLRKRANLLRRGEGTKVSAAESE